MNGDRWSKKEKAVARRAFEDAYQRECSDLMKQIQQRSGQLSDPKDIWYLHDFLAKRIREIERKYDFRYSILILVLAQLLKEGWIKIDELEDLSEGKISKIRYLAKM